MSSPTERLNALTDKNGRRLQPLLEDMRLRENAVIICSFGGDDPFAPISRHLAEDHETQIAAGLDLLAEVCGCTDIIIYAAQLDLNVLADRLSGRYNITVKTGVSSPVLREPTALYSVIDTGVIRAGNAEEEYKKTFPSYGYRGRPTLSVDAETVYQAYRLARSLGMTKHAAVIGKETVISEAGIGAPLETLLEKTADITCALLGGVWGRFLNAAELSLTALGCEYLFDCIKPLGEADCIVNEAAALYRSAAELSCKKCVLCREGSWQIKAIFTDITEGKAAREDIALIEDVCPLIAAGSLCAFGKNMVLPALSAASDFRDDINGHIVGKRCRAGKCRGLVSFQIDPALCTGCGECMDSCAEEAIEGADGYIHMIDDKLCVKCGKCVPACPEEAIKFGGNKIKVPKKLTKVGRFH